MDQSNNSGSDFSENERSDLNYGLFENDPSLSPPPISPSEQSARAGNSRFYVSLEPEDYERARNITTARNYSPARAFQNASREMSSRSSLESERCVSPRRRARNIIFGSNYVPSRAPQEYEGEFGCQCYDSLEHERGISPRLRARNNVSPLSFGNVLVEMSPEIQDSPVYSQEHHYSTINYEDLRTTMSLPRTSRPLPRIPRPLPRTPSPRARSPPLRGDVFAEMSPEIEDSPDYSQEHQYSTINYEDLRTTMSMPRTSRPLPRIPRPLPRTPSPRAGYPPLRADALTEMIIEIQNPQHYSKDRQHFDINSDDVLTPRTLPRTPKHLPGPPRPMPRTPSPLQKISMPLPRTPRPLPRTPRPLPRTPMESTRTPSQRPRSPPLRGDVLTEMSPETHDPLYFTLDPQYIGINYVDARTPMPLSRTASPRARSPPLRVNAVCEIHRQKAEEDNQNEMNAVPGPSCRSPPLLTRRTLNSDKERYPKNPTSRQWKSESDDEDFCDDV